ncbi:MAG: VOC family protein [Acidimicrobiales bacterium]
MLRLRQIALASQGLAEAERSLSGLLDLEVCYRDPNVIVFGLHNTLFPIGDRFIEIVSPMQEGTTAGRLLKKRGGDCGYMALFQTDDLESARRRIEQAGVRTVFVAEGDGIRGIHLHPKDLPGAIVSIDEAEHPAEWPWAGTDWRSHQHGTVVTDLVGIELRVADPAGAAAKWAAVLGCSVADNVVAVDDAEVRFLPIDDDQQGIAAIDVVAADHSEVGRSVDCLGVTFLFV